MTRIFAAFYLLVHTAYAQDPLFTQINSAPHHLNPAWGNTDTASRVDLAQRIQWPALNGGGYNTFFGSYQHYIPVLNGYAGLNFTLRDDGAMTSNLYQFNYSQSIRLGKHSMLRPAIEIGYFTKKLDWSAFTFGDQVDPRAGIIYNTGDTARDGKASGFDINAGLLFYIHRFSLGISGHHLTQPDQSLLGKKSHLPLRFGMQLAYCSKSFGMRVPVSLLPYFTFTAQGNFHTYMTGINTEVFNHVIIGAGYRKQDALLMNAGYRNRHFRIVYSFDYTTNKLGINTGGSHELSLSLYFWKQKTSRHFLKMALPT